MRPWGFYEGNDFFDSILSQFTFSSSLLPPNPPPPVFHLPLLFTVCSGWQHVGSSDRPVPHAGRVHHVLLARGELGPEGGPGAL